MIDTHERDHDLRTNTRHTLLQTASLHGYPGLVAPGGQFVQGQERWHAWVERTDHTLASLDAMNARLANRLSRRGND